MNKIGIHYAVWGNEWAVDMCERVKLAAKAGFDVLEVTPPDYMNELDEKKMKELKQCADDNGIEMSYCIGFPKDFDMASEDAAQRRKGIEHTKKLLKAINIMGGKVLSGILYSYWPYDFPTPLPDKRKMWDIALESVKECVKCAQDNDVVFAIELVNRFEQYLLNSVDEGVEFVDAVGSRYCGLLLDTFHMGIEEESSPDAIRKAGERMKHMHIGKSNRGIPGPCDNVPWDKIAVALKDINYDGRIVMEPFIISGGPVGRDVSLWRDIAADKSEPAITSALREGIDFVKNTFK